MMRHIILLVFCGTLLTGCGKKGPLYMPDEQTSTQADSAQASPADSVNTAKSN